MADAASATSSSTPPPPPRTALEDGEGDASTPRPACAGTGDKVPDPDDDEDANDNVPLLSSLFQKSVKVGPFSIRYNNPSSPRPKPPRLYDGPSSGGGTYRDFGNDPLTLYDADGAEDGEEDGRSPRQSRVHRILRRVLSTNCCRRFLPLRIFLLALYLASTLASFWILDSLKEPTLAILVDGDLGKHQPRAKMTSFVVVVGLAVAMEWTNLARQRRSKMRQNAGRGAGDELDANAALEKSWADRNLPSSMRDDDEGGANRWRKMSIRTSQFWKHLHWGGHGHDDDAGQSPSKITTLAFYVVGSLYIHFFITVAVALRQHPSFRPNSIFHDANDVDDLASTNWYYPALGYFLFALIESFGSVSITIFWAFANSHLTLEAAERHYGSVVALAQVGAIAGSTLSAILGRRRRDQSAISDDVAEDEGNDAQVTPLLIFWACGCIGAGMAIMTIYSQMFSKPMRQTTQGLAHVNAEDCDERLERDEYAPRSPSNLHREGESGDSSRSILRDLFGGVDMIFRHKYLTFVLAVSVLYEVALTCMNYEMNLIGLDRFGVGISIVNESELGDEHAETNDQTETDEGITYIQFMGWYGQTVNVLSLFLSFYAFPRLIKNYGLRITIRIFPTVLLLVTIFAFVLFPQNLYFLFISLSVCKALTYSVHDPSEEVLYMPTSDDAKFRAKFWIDVVGQRIAKALGSAITNYAGSVEGIVKYGSLPSVVASLALWLACYQVGLLFDSLIKTGSVVGADEEREEEGGLEMSVVEDEIAPTTSNQMPSKVESTLL